MTPYLTELREAMARAIYLVKWGSEQYDYGIGGVERAKARECADAALAALRLVNARHGAKVTTGEPSEAMVEAAVKTFVRENGGIEHAPFKTWIAMHADAPDLLDQTKPTEGT